MSSAWIIITALGAAGYLFLVFRITRGLFRLKLSPQNNEPAEFGIDNSPFPDVSIIIAARNEEDEIGATLESLQNQDYPADKVEIIVVNDRSTDSTADIVTRFGQNNPHIRLVNIETVTPGISPKKQALEQGIRAARHKIIVTTDADCRHSRQWLKSLAGSFRSDIGMVAGQARFNIGTSPPLWQRMQALDFQSQGIAAAGLISDGMPFNCTGASLAFRLDMFDEVGGYKGVENLISGDDELLLAKAAVSRWKIKAARGQDIIVITRPPADLNELWQQRSRWGSKGLHYKPSRKLVLSLVFLFFLGLSFGPVIAVFTGLWQAWACAALFKLALDATAITCGARVFEEKFNWVDFFMLEIIHAPALVLFTLSGHFAGFEWKGQRFRNISTKNHAE